MINKTKIGNICLDIHSLKKEDFEEVQQIIDEQKRYSHPLKNATATRQHKLANHNAQVLEKIKELQSLIRQFQ